MVGLGGLKPPTSSLSEGIAAKLSLVCLNKRHSIFFMAILEINNIGGNLNYEKK